MTVFFDGFRARTFVPFFAFVLLGAWLALAAEEPAGGAIRPGPEFSPAGDSKNMQRLPAAAFGGGTYFVVWQDGWNGVGGDSNILGARIKAGAADDNPKPEDAEPLKLCVEPGHQEAPQVAFGGGVFLAVWHDFRNGQDADVYATRVTPDGKILDPQGIAVAARPRNQNFPLVCSDGENFLVLWREVRHGQTYDMMAARVEAATGKVLDEKGVLIAGDAASPAVGFSGERYFIAWMVSHGKGARLGFCRYAPKDLSRMENEPTVFGHADAFGKTGQVKLISGAGEVVALWARGVNPDPWGWGGPGAILSARVRDDGAVPENSAFNKIRWSPEGREQYVKRFLPGVLDTALWKGFDGWPQGRPGGFKEATDGLWPHAYLAGTPLPGRKGQYFAVWVRAHLRGLAQTGRFTVLGGRLKSGEAWEAPDYPPTVLAAAGACSLPTVCGGEADGPFLLAYERRDDEGPATVKAKFVRVQPIP